MKSKVTVLSVFVSLSALVLSAFFATSLNGQQPTADDVRAFKLCEGVVQLFKQFPDSIWPGYDLSRRPFMFYTPDRAFLFNYAKDIEGFKAHPKDWPDLGTRVLVYEGLYQNLSGQLGFGLSVDTVDFAAVPFVEKSDVGLFAFIVHENFHEYQQYGKHPAFGEIPWEREEKYPIENAENTALAYLEMRLLMDALQAAADGDDAGCRKLTRQFVAVRDRRWKQSDSFVARYEQGQEINEGTAKYVELKSIDLFTHLKYKSSLSSLTTPLSEDFDSVSMPQYLLDEFRNRITGHSVSPEDMPRYRIYPVGSAQGFLLDHFNVDWKSRAQKAGSDFTYAGLLRDRLGVKDDELDGLVDEARQAYNYNEVLAATDSLIGEYTRGFNDALGAFESQDGYRVEIDLSGKNLRRSRSSSVKHWLMDKGTRELCGNFDIYVLESALDTTLFFRLQNTGLLEENDWDAGTKRIVLFVPEITSISLDGRPVQIAEAGERRFESAEVAGPNLEFKYCKHGTITLADHAVIVSLIP